MNEFEPQDLASCPHCRSLVLTLRFVDGRLELLDPSFGIRRWLVSLIGIRTWAEWLELGQGWGASYNHSHVCPTVDQLLLRELWQQDPQRN